MIRNEEVNAIFTYYFEARIGSWNMLRDGNIVLPLENEIAMEKINNLCILYRALKTTMKSKDPEALLDLCKTSFAEIETDEKDNHSSSSWLYGWSRPNPLLACSLRAVSSYIVNEVIDKKSTTEEAIKELELEIKNLKSLSNRTPEQEKTLISKKADLENAILANYHKKDFLTVVKEEDKRLKKYKFQNIQTFAEFVDSYKKKPEDEAESKAVKKIEDITEKKIDSKTHSFETLSKIYNLWHKKYLHTPVGESTIMYFQPASLKAPKLDKLSKKQNRRELHMEQEKRAANNHS